MMQINFKNFGMNMSFLFTMARELFAGLYYRAYSKQEKNLSEDLR